MVNDPHRPVYHFTSGNWMNDPKPFFWDGAYHVFFQHNPHEAAWGPMHWGHAVSRDLVHWERLPIALAPTPGGPDQAGCWTGCVVRGDDERFHILYTGIPRLDPLQQVQCLATSDDLLHWEKRAEPVIAGPPPGFGPCFRDPQAWKEGDRWRMVIGSEVAGRGGAALLYESSDLARWTYLGPLFVGRTEETGHDFECPDFFPLENRYVLLTSRDKTWWHIGDYRGETFRRDAWGAADGGSLYAAKTLQDDQGRRLLFGWVREERPTEEQRAAGWSGALSLPHLLTLREDGTLGVEPVPELAALRGTHRRFENLRVGAGETVLLPGIESDTCEIQVRFARKDAARFGVHIRCSPDGAEKTTLLYDRNRQRLLDTPLMLGEEEELTLRIFVDRSVIEVFANGRASQTLRTYPKRADALGAALFAEGDGAQATVDVWEMKAAADQ